MEFIDGRTLRAMITEGCPLNALAQLGSQMAKGLAAAHRSGINHRDIKPENIMVRDDGYVKMLDFGLARLVPSGMDREAATLQFTQPGTLLGSVRYMSPEQARGESVNHPSDIFSLGIIFYEMATGRHPFATDSILGTLNAIEGQVPEPSGHLLFSRRRPREPRTRRRRRRHAARSWLNAVGTSGPLSGLGTCHYRHTPYIYVKPDSFGGFEELRD
jgi:serine/threonine protein kinase